MGRPSLSLLQSIVGLLAGITSIAGAGYSAMRYLSPADTGEIVAVVQEARTERPIADASIDIFTPQERLVTTLRPGDDGRIRRSLQEGAYRLRVSHPRFDPEARQIQVLPGETAEISFRMNERRASSSAATAAARAANKGVSATRRFFRNLGL